jgi:serine phosphatase RsbU (regulator of sigma subunit)
MDEGDRENPDLTEKTMVMRGGAVAAPVLQIGHYLSFSENGATRRLRIGPSGITIGRLATCDISFPVQEVSRQHCRVQTEGSGVSLVDLGSTNGTFIGGRRIERPMAVEHGGSFTVGSHVVRYERRDEREVAEEARLNSELRQAVEYVRAILPEPISTGPVRAEWWYVPSSELGGDAFGYQFLDETTVFGFLLDVSGHGIGAGLHAANVATVLRRRALPGVDFSDPGAVASALNTMFPMEDHGGLMFTIWYFTFRTDTRSLRYCAAGHHAAFLASLAEPDAIALWQRAPSIGMLPARNWPTAEMTLPADSRLYLFSDGAFEIIERDGTAWQIDNLRHVIGAGPTQGIGEAQRLYQAVRAAAKPGPLDDDFSTLVLHFT